MSTECEEYAYLRSPLVLVRVEGKDEQWCMSCLMKQARFLVSIG